jgi:hypothetical protein
MRPTHYSPEMRHFSACGLEPSLTSTWTPKLDGVTCGSCKRTDVYRLHRFQRRGSSSAEQVAVEVPGTNKTPSPKDIKP